MYALRRIALDSHRDATTVKNVLSTFTRERMEKLATSSPANASSTTARGRIDPEIEAALTVFGELTTRYKDHRYKMDLRYVQASGIYLRGAQLNGVDLEGANLSGADLADTDFTEASPGLLTEVNLRGANLSGADLSAMWLSETDLRKADLRNAVLSGAELTVALLDKADLRGADLSGVNSRSETTETNGSTTTTNYIPIQEADIRRIAITDAQTKF
jgi:uncharacterized protein YjbI with pentapeptide repeats